MRRVDMRGTVLLNVLIALAVLGILLSAALPAAFTLYARAAVEYEAVHLIGELRRIQAISRTTAMPLYMLEGRLSWERAPRLNIRADGYTLHRPFGEDVRSYTLLPLVRFKQDTATETPVIFDRNGNIADGSHNMTIRVYAAGHEEAALCVVIDRAARIRLHRGEDNAVDEG